MARRKKPSIASPMQTRRSRLRANQSVQTPIESQIPLTEQPSTSNTNVQNVTPLENDNKEIEKNHIEIEHKTTENEIDKPGEDIQNDTDTNSVPSPAIPTVVLHKKFGKYLLMNDEAFAKRFEAGSDSETNSSIEIRVADPCASSESDSNVPQDTQLDTTSNKYAFSPNINLDSNVSSPALSIKETNTKEDLVENLSEAQEHKDEINECVEMNNDNDGAIENVDLENLYGDIPLPADPESQDVEDQEDSDDEVITVVQIMEDDNSDVYYDIKMDSAEEQYTYNGTPHVPPDPIVEPPENNSFQETFQNLNLTEDVSKDASYVSNMPCNLADIPSPIGRPQNEVIRPDPSPTPSSLLSDDSNSSRVLSETNIVNSNDSSESSPSIRRSSRIKTISSLKQKTRGHGLVKTPLKKALISQTIMKLEESTSDSLPSFNGSTSNSPSFPIPSLDMPVKVKSRWRRSSELEMHSNSPVNSPLASPKLCSRLMVLTESIPLPEQKEEKEDIMSACESETVIQDRLKQFTHLDENDYKCERQVSKEAKRMTCDCFMTKEEVERGELGCGEDCLNRLLMIECNYRCPVGDRCTNRRFQKRENATLSVFYADKKGCGLEAAVDIPTGEFLMEYVGEVLNPDQFYQRAQEYSDANNLHHYFMSLMGETVIDATMKGNISRFINHSCEPNAETQKWTVNGELRIGFFSKRDIPRGEEITFDYQFQRFGKEAQRCYCGAGNCRGWIGAEPDSDEDYEEGEDDVSTTKSSAKDPTDTISEPGAETATTAEDHDTKVKEKKKRCRIKGFSMRPKAELAQDADIEEDLEALARTGIKNQSHTLTLSRTMVRAKTRKTQTALLRLLREADLPCRRLFLDYRGLRLLAPWCSNATLDFRLEMLQTLDRLPVPNKTMVQECRLLTTVERWRSEACEPPPAESSSEVFIDEATGLPIAVPNVMPREPTDKAKDNPAVRLKVSDLSKQLQERWSSLKEVFKIPKKERIQQMKEHERQANVERRAADSSGARDRDRHSARERDKEGDRYTAREREKERERDDRDRRKRKISPEGRRSIRLDERVLASIPPMSKEERRRAFAEAAAVAEQNRQTEQQRQKEQWQQFQQWPGDGFPPGMFPPGMMGGPPGMLPPGMLPPGMLPPGMMPGMMGGPPMMGIMGGEMPQEWIGSNGEYMGPPPGYGQMQFGAPPPFCMPQPNFMGMGPMGGGFPMGGYMFPPHLPQMPPSFPPPPTALTQPPPGTADVLPEEQVPNAKSSGLMPSMWRSAQDSRGRTYYYHVKHRVPQWTPPTPPPPPSDDEASSEEEELSTLDKAIVRGRAQGRLVEGVDGIYEVIKQFPQNGLLPERAVLSSGKRRPGLVSERPISPRSEEDKLAGKMEVKRYRQTKEKLRRRKERLLMKVLQRTDKYKTETLTVTDSDEEEAPAAAPPPEPAPSPVPELPTAEEVEETTRRLKEAFRSSMARVMVQHLNCYRRRDATHAKITNTADFKHLARKLTHFVMLKELKHCRSVEELECNDSVKQKAKEFVKKYMAKFGPVYQRPPEEMD